MSPAVARATADPWSISEYDYPESGTAAERFQFLVNYAVLAASSHNTQPWLFRLRGSTLELYADRTRALPVVDPDDRELTISCGSALFTLRVAMRHFGLRDVVEVLPAPESPDLIARVSFPTERYYASQEEHAMFRAIVKRRTNRQRFEAREVPDAALVDLQAAAQVEGTSLNVIRGERRRTAVVDLIAAGDRAQMASKSFRRELAAWVRPNYSRAKDGVPGYGLGFSDFASLTGPFVIRTFDLGNFQAARDRELAEGSPVLAVLDTAADLPRDWVAAGQALARVLLLAQSKGLSASFLNQPVEVEELRPMLREALDADGYPQVVLRIGYGPEVRPTPRRPAADVCALE